MPTIYDYFHDQLGRYPADQTLADLPLDSVCGQDCKRAIDLARRYLDAVDGHPDVVGPLINSVEAAVSVFWIG